MPWWQHLPIPLYIRISRINSYQMSTWPHRVSWDQPGLAGLDSQTDSLHSFWKLASTRWNDVPPPRQRVSLCHWPYNLRCYGGPTEEAHSTQLPPVHLSHRFYHWKDMSHVGLRSVLLGQYECIFLGGGVGAGFKWIHVTVHECHVLWVALDM